MNQEERARLEERQRQKKIRERRRKKQVRRQKMLLAGIIMIIVIITAGVNIVKNNRKKAEQAAVTKAKQEKLAKQKQEELEKENTLSMIAVGDNLYHDAILEEGKTDSGAWNFDFLYQNVKKEIEEADLSAVNQETVFVNNHDEVAGYPEFASPLEGGDALIKAGFNIVTQASNHAYDKGKAGILNSVTFWRTSHPNVTLLGIHKDQQDEERNRIQVVEKKNFKIAMMNYTFGLNEATPLPEDESYSIDVFDEEQVAKDIETAKSESDVVIVFLHTGVEDTTDIDEDTENRIDFLASQGVDITICSHPHVIRAFGMKERADGGQMLVYYSLGNFVSTQEAIPELLEGMAKFTLKKDLDTGKVTVSDYSMQPLVMHYDTGKTNCAVYKLSDYTEELAKAHGIHEYSEEEFTLESIQEFFAPFLTPQTFASGSQKDSD